MDLETILIDNVHVPYLLSWYNGKNTHSYFIHSTNTYSLEENILKMVESAMNDICTRKYRNYRVYLHNFSKFDGYFLTKYLSKLGYCDPIIHKGRIISLNFTSHNSPYTIIFKDSYLLLPASLRSLGKSFGINAQKGIFPYKFGDINFTGPVPDITYFTHLSLIDYEIYKQSYNGNIWSFKKEALKYCELDCISLFQILAKFNRLIFDKFSLNINDYPTLPSLSFAIFRTHYLPENSIHMLSGNVSKTIRTSYTGGSVDMYIPKLPTYDGPFKVKKHLTKKVYCYDVNALYPFVMANFRMPIGSPTYFEGDIFKKMDNPFGFFFCKITAPNNLKNPIIQTHIQTKDGMRTVSPLGT